MSEVLALRPFVPAQDYAVSKRFYQALGFTLTQGDEHVSILKTGSFSFLLQSFYHKDMAENLMVHLLVRDADAWWRTHDPVRLVTEFATKPPRPPAMQPWGLKVGFVFDPSGVLWHIAEAPF